MPKTTSSKKATANAGAAQTRKEFIARLTRQRDKYILHTSEWIVLDDEIKWVRTQAKRAGERVGGLGRR